MSKRPDKPKREDFNEAAFRVVREATKEHEPEPEPQADGDSGPEPQEAEPTRKPS